MKTELPPGVLAIASKTPRDELRIFFYGEALPRGPTPYQFHYTIFHRKGTPLVNL